MAKAKKFKRVVLTPEQLQELKDAIISGESPKSIHERLGVTLANIHYHKAELKKKNLLTGLPSKNAAPTKETAAKPETIKKSKAIYNTTPETSTKVIAKKEAFKLIVNGVNVQIEGASSVSVGEGYVKVDF